VFGRPTFRTTPKVRSYSRIDRVLGLRSTADTERTDPLGEAEVSGLLERRLVSGDG
jgi:hypothetical protein